MEGNFLTKTQRQKFVNEIKKTHFKLGNYKPEEEMLKEVKTERAVTASSLAGMMRSTHFELGNDKPVVKSEANSRFRPVEVPKCPYVVPDVSIDLRKTHYSLGSFNQIPASTARSAQVSQTAQGERAPTIMTADFSTSHHFQYGNDKPSYLPINKSDFNRKNLPKDLKEEVSKIKKELRKTHFEVGSQKPEYLTNHKNDFSGKQTEVVKASMDLQKEHFRLGTDKANYLTTYKSSEKNILKGKQDFQSEVLKDLRCSHFKLGTSSSEYIKTSQDFRGGKGETAEKVQDGRLRKTNFVLGTHEKPWTSSYKDSHSNSSASLAVSVRDRHTDKASHFVLGSSGNDFLSVHQQDFKELEVINNRDSKWAEYLRGHHFDMGQAKPCFSSQNQKYGKGKAEVVETDKKLSSDLRTSHFQLGNDKPDMVTTSQNSFKNMKSSRSVQSLDKAHGKHSYRDGDSKFQGTTEQKSRFRWIKPIADNKFKFSFE
jgi:hypothetical protein